LQFLFIDGADLSDFGGTPYKLKETLKTMSPSGAVITTTKTVFNKPGVGTYRLTSALSSRKNSDFNDLCRLRRLSAF